MIQKLFSRLTIKLLLIVIAIILLIASLVYFSINENRITAQEKLRAEEKKAAFVKKEIDDSLAQTTDWTVTEIKQIGLTDILLKTKYVEGRMYYYLKCSYIDAKRPLPRGRYDAKFTVEFFDKDGFSVFSKDLLLSDRVDRVSGTGIALGFEYRGNFFLSKAVYRSFKDWDLLWQF